ncbi:MAG: Gfo/Idh/MocA family oxidoreductase [Verrucomicrobiota bacterium]|nr:Gfo/Idh/MocA family oxidoreductase [Verrucomicrobiota bacterium]
MKTTINRRTFLKTTAATTAGAFILPRFSIGQAGSSANSKVNIAMIGAAGIAGMAYNECKGENIVALCDIDRRRFPGWAAKKGTPTYSDFRVMLDKMGSEIDAVCINTPDHTHFAATLDSMQRGKHVCTQKPLTHNIWEARTLRKAKDKYGVVTNMANQGHTSDGIRTMREWYEADVFGQITEVHFGVSGPNWGSKYFKKPVQTPLERQPIPEEVDWDLWLGPAQETAYNDIYHPLTWRSFNDFGTGQFGDWFCHTGDGPVWILDLYDPIVVECVERGPALEGMIPDYSVVRYDFPTRGDKTACSMYWYEGSRNGGLPIKSPSEWDLGNIPDGGSFWYGDKQNGYLDNRSNNPRLTSREVFKEFKENTTIEERYPRIKQKGPFAEWIAVIKGDLPECGSNFDYAAPLTEVALLGVLAQRFGGRIEWDPAIGVLNRPELNIFIKEPARDGWWQYGEDLWS